MDLFEFKGDGYTVLTLSFIIGLLLNIFTNFITYFLKGLKDTKVEIKKLVSILDHDLNTFIKMANLIENDFKKGGIIWYEHTTHILDSRTNYTLKDLFLLSRDLKERFLSYYTTTVNLISLLNHNQKELSETHNRMDEQNKEKNLTILDKRQSDLIIDLRLKKMESETLRKDLQNEFKFLKN